MKVRGWIIFGSATIGGAIQCEITTEDKQIFLFTGGVGGFGSTVSGSAKIPVEGTFTGLSHILPSSAVEIAHAGMALDGFQATFFDTQGHIGTVGGVGIGGGVFLGIGGGKWEKKQ
jgi:hypothetical protein